MEQFKEINIQDLNKDAIKTLTFENLVSDAAARKDKAAYEFLRRIIDENQNKSPRSRQRIQTIRIEYLTKFCGYQLESKKNKSKSKIEKQQLLLDSIADLFE